MSDFMSRPSFLLRVEMGHAISDPRAQMVASGVTTDPSKSLDDWIAEALADGFEIVQQGAVVAPSAQGVSFNERTEGFDIHLLGHYGPPTWRSQYDNRLYDDETRWVHLRRIREEHSA